MRVWRRRRLLLSKWRRSTRWEFWPPWAFYPPLSAYLAYLMVKHRSTTVFTAANPSILGGGFVGESKFGILQGLAGAGDWVARLCLVGGHLGPDAKLAAATRFMTECDLAFPVVL